MSCKRHKWAEIRRWLADFPGPSGYPSGERRIMIQRKCKCGVIDVKWEKKPELCKSTI